MPTPALQPIKYMKSKILIYLAMALVAFAVGIILSKKPSAGLAKQFGQSERSYHNRGDGGESDFHSNRRPVPLKSEKNSRRIAFDRLLNSSSRTEKLAAAAMVAAFNDEAALEILAQSIAQVEASGENDDLELARQLGEILSGMHGEQLIELAQELAYSSSQTVSEAATNVAVASAGGGMSEGFEATTEGNASSDLTEIVQELLQSEQ